MREVTAKSMKLNRDLEKMLSEALDRDLLVRIGWGRGGDEKPKEGEIGVITHLPEKSRVLLLGNLGECAGAMNQGGNFTLQGHCSSMAGAFQERGRIIIEKDAGDKIGTHMIGGMINVQGSVSNNAGELMRGGTIIVKGHSGERTGAGMSGGTIIVLGSVGKEPGVGMTGGKIIVAGNCPPPGQGADMRSMESNEISEISEHLEPLGLSINKDALVIVAVDKSDNNTKTPKSSITEGFEKISITTSSSKSLSEYNALDNHTLINSIGNEDEGLLFPIPWLIERDEGITENSEIVSQQPFLVKSNPRNNDLLIINKENIITATKDLGKCSGIVLNMTSLPSMNDAEIEALIVSMTSKVQEKSLIMLKDRVERVENLFRLIVELNLDGAIVDASSPGGSRAAAALPRIGLAARAINMKEQNKTLMIELDKCPSAEDLIVAKGAGFSVIVAPQTNEKISIEETLIELNSNLRGWMINLGIQSLEEVTRRNLRAMDYDTAAISGLRLIGYDRPLPMWLGN
ncbi:MAG: hypothetical protein HOJ39_01775 [Euryarchaeota archaeon]|nr:hypothetical protein [Euryarchaeota archaeon]MBT4475020.1 hypothetical protein [Euryarchaeota archaeon]MBT4794142.1 hypothetical protein [Euryarchaeota archaeon]MBT5639092.1 hypothetical protein [Euryarchaeota archaeon]MBT6559783.1 hypothetical protein [Euryarchaeota archaeon]